MILDIGILPHNNLKEIDAKGGFEADDEIGQTFKAIKDEIEKLEGIYGGN